MVEEPQPSASITPLDDDEEEEAPILSQALPDFSDDEAPAPAAPVASSSARILKGIPGRKKIPIAAIKKKLGGGSSSKDKKGKDASAATPVPISDEAMAAFMKQLMTEEGPETANLDPKDVKEAATQFGLTKEFFQGKTGLMGKGTKDMA